MDFFTEIILHLSVKVLGHLGQVIIVLQIKLMVTGLVFGYLKDVSPLIRYLIQEALRAKNLCDSRK